MQENAENICVIQKNAVPLHRFFGKQCEKSHSGYSSARLECLLWEQEVVSSNLAIPTKETALLAVSFLFDNPNSALHGVVILSDNSHS